MFFAMLLRSFKLYMNPPTIVVHNTIVVETHIVIMSLSMLNNSFCSVNFITFAFVENMPANFSLLL
jgi:hypothetical protein